MSILADVRERYGFSEIPKALTAKTAKSPSGSKGSECFEGSEKMLAELKPDEREAGEALLTAIQMRERGEVPPHYTAVTNCQRCGTVPVWPGCPSEVIACPWCFTGRLPK
jgi:hypothetical protein